MTDLLHGWSTSMSPLSGRQGSKTSQDLQVSDHAAFLRHGGSTQRWEVEHSPLDLAERVRPCFECDRHMPVCLAVEYLQLGCHSMFDPSARSPS